VNQRQNLLSEPQGYNFKAIALLKSLLYFGELVVLQ